MIQPGPTLDHGCVHLNFPTFGDLFNRLADVLVRKSNFAQVPARLSRPKHFHYRRQIQGVNARAEYPRESQLVAGGGVETARRFAEPAQEIPTQKADGPGDPQQPGKVRLESFGGKGAGQSDHGAPDLPSHMIVHDHPAPGIGRPLRAVCRLGLRDHRQRYVRQIRMRRQSQENLPVGKRYVGEHHQINPRAGESVRDRQRLVRTEDPLGDDRLRIDLLGFDQLVEALANSLLGAVLRDRVEHLDRVDHQSELGCWPLLQWSSHNLCFSASPKGNS